jgi:23S rRNA (uracil1939-C5)-methyltransferase
MSREPLEVTIEKLVYGGHGLARVDGRVLLTPLVLPGERVLVEQTEKLHAVVREIQTPAPERVAAPCPYFGVCGGCHYQHAPYEYQLTQKLEILREVMRRIGKIDAPADIRIVRGPEWNYRNRTQLHISDGRIGYLRLGSHTLCPVDLCPISSPQINEAIAALTQMVRDRRFPSFVRTVELFTNERDVQLNVLETGKPLARHFFDWCAERIPGYASGAIDYDGFRIGPRSFFQVNRFLIGDLVSAAIGDATGDTALDLYAGAGLFSRPLAARFAHVIAVESGASAVADLKHNVPGAEAVRSSVDVFLQNLHHRPDLVVADPPREGLGKVVVRELARLKPRRLNIVACDPATLARDLRGLIDAGYTIDRMILVDLFPQTYHLETVVHLSHT